jgi:ElaB/YqjD/DUF883 family membrane-anchored ribosome-binding protein
MKITLSILNIVLYNLGMKKAVRTVTINIQKLFAKKGSRSLTDQDKLRQSARATLKKYHATFRKLAHE